MSSLEDLRFDDAASRGAGADVAIRFFQSRHELTGDDVDLARLFI